MLCCRSDKSENLLKNFRIRKKRNLDRVFEVDELCVEDFINGMVGAESLDAFSHSIVQENLNENLNLKKRAFWNIGFLLSLSGLLDFY